MCPAVTISDPVRSAELLHHPALGVRPPGHPLPPHLQGSLLGTLFRRWLRQRDDAARQRPKQALQEAMAALPADALSAHARQQARLARQGGDWNHWSWATPVATLASLLGLELAQATLREHMQTLARALQAGATSDQVGAADITCAALLKALREANGATPLHACLARYAPLAIWQDEAEFEANRLALLWQGYEAGAALLSQALALLSQQPALRCPGNMRDWLPGVISAGGAVMNTRRFAQVTLQLEEATLEPGALLILPLNDVSAPALGFGAGPHRCPGQDLALGSAAAALEQLLDHPPAHWPLVRDWLHLPNARVAVFEAQEVLP
jgi:cytochrome P450